MSARALEILRTVDMIAAEDTRNTGGLLKHYGIKQRLIAYHDHNEAASAANLVKLLREGNNIALVSDAGLPLIADPGYRLIGACADADIKVTVIPGANAALAALILSGLTTDRFYFHGFLPAKAGPRQRELQSLSAYPMTLIFYEAPHRLVECLEDIAASYGTRPAAVVREITKMFEEARRGTAAELAAHYTETPPKGECVIVVGGQTEAAVTSDADIDDLLRTALTTLKVKDAAKAVAAQTGGKISDLYARALELQKQ